MSTKTFLEVGAKRVASEQEWYRYLRKIISKDGVALSERDYQALLTSPHLSTSQKKSLEELKNTSSTTYKNVTRLNGPAQLTVLDNLKGK